MSQQPLTTQQEDAAATVRAILLDGACAVDDFARGSDKSVRTVYAWIALGLPTIRIGKTPYVLIEPARDWLRSRKVRGQQRRRHGHSSSGATQTHAKGRLTPARSYAAEDVA